MTSWCQREGSQRFSSHCAICSYLPKFQSAPAYMTSEVTMGVIHPSNGLPGVVTVNAGGQNSFTSDQPVVMTCLYSTRPVRPPKNNRTIRAARRIFQWHLLAWAMKFFATRFLFGAKIFQDLCGFFEGLPKKKKLKQKRWEKIIQHGDLKASWDLNLSPHNEQSTVVRSVRAGPKSLISNDWSRFAKFAGMISLKGVSISQVWPEEEIWVRSNLGFSSRFLDKKTPSFAMSFHFWLGILWEDVSILIVMCSSGCVFPV